MDFQLFSRNKCAILQAFAFFYLLFYVVILNCSETIILTPKDFSKIKIKFDFNPQAESPTKYGGRFSTSVRDEQPSVPFDAELSRSVVSEKLSRLRNYLRAERNSSRDNAVDLLLDPYVTQVSTLEYKLNISIDNVQISGLSSFTVSDIAANAKSKKISALLRSPDIRITFFYKVNGLKNLSSSMSQVYSDKGKATYVVYGWRTVFAGKVVNIINGTQLEMAGFGMRSHYDFYESNLESFVYDSDKSDLVDFCKFTSSELIKKVINAVDDRYENVMLEKLDVIELATWPFQDRFQSEDGGPLLMMESKLSERGNSRGKRQVPCEVGEELDEYVDSLFRFLRRLVRVMEPFNLPNTTIELEEYNLQIFLHSCHATRAYTFERKRPAWVLCQNETISLGLTVGIEDARVMCRYRVIQDWRLLFDGDLEAQIRRPKAQVQITQLSPPENEDEEAEDTGDEEEQQVQQRIDRLKVWKPGQIVVLIRGLGNLSSALSMIINQMLTDTSTLDPIIQMIETDGVVAANEMLKNVSIPIFSII